MKLNAHTQRIKSRFLNQLGERNIVQNLFEDLPDIHFFMKNDQCQFITGNKPLLKLCGVETEDEIIGKTDFDFFPREFATVFFKDDKEVVQRGISVHNKLEIVPNQDGSINWNVTTKLPLYNKQNKIIGLTGYTRDYNRAQNSMKPYTELAHILDYINQHYAEKLEVTQIAKMSNLSLSQFERKFKKTFQTSPIKYILNVRMNAACRQLINTNDQISEIAIRTGFYDASYFTRQFIKMMGTTPLKYRKQQQAQF